MLFFYSSVLWEDNRFYLPNHCRAIDAPFFFYRVKGENEMKWDK